MKAYPNGGTDHFGEPVVRIATRRRTLNGDTSGVNVEKHPSKPFGTRDRINTWMQGHLEDYR
ncbi:hypothetical protein [Streptomyces sp. NBC_00316]|uniref:hypothetical protein n=1 Tax=Streptomyces sp. NBC_00316 TaxID=2975710 RepID=UPI002E2C15E0|nr:hypothetical protein [Streptomyces sp. NBC_00316]